MHTSWALIAESSSGSTWMNHVLSSHPCVASANEILMNNLSLQHLFHGDLSDVRRAIHFINQSSYAKVLAQAQNSTCNDTSSGVKLKMASRDITFGPSGSAKNVLQVLSEFGWKVIVLHRTNYLEQMMSSISRHRTGVMHCKTSRGCLPSQLNMSVMPSCERTKLWIDKYGLAERSFAEILAQSPLAGSANLVHVKYEEIVQQSTQWLKLVTFVGLQPTDACKLHEDSHAKRVQQTQREIIQDWPTFETCMRSMGAQYAKHLNPDVRPISGRLPRYEKECETRELTAT